MKQNSQMTHNRLPVSGYLVFLLFLPASLMLISCGSSHIGYGVLLWPSDSDIPDTGSVVRIVSESEIRGTYIYSTIDGDQEYETPRWRLHFDKNREEADVFAASYDPWISYFAVVEQDGLAVRQEPDVESERLYKLKQGQKIKILDREEEKAYVGEHSGYWYTVLTEDGTVGYCFDYYIRAYDSATESGEARQSDTTAADMLFSRIYRPEYFLDMVRNQRIDLGRFNPDIGFSVNPEQKIIRIVTATDHQVYTYTAVKIQDDNRVVFVDSSVQVSVLSPTQITVTYSTTSETKYERYVFIEDVDGIIESELGRREEEFRHLLELGPAFESSFYGSMTFQEDMRFLWAGNSRLVPDVLPRDAGNTGRVELRYFLSSELRSAYDGILSFHFDNMSPDTFVNFLYTVTATGLKLTHLPKSNIENSVAIKDVAIPLVISFIPAEAQ